MLQDRSVAGKTRCVKSPVSAQSRLASGPRFVLLEDCPPKSKFVLCARESTRKQGPTLPSQIVSVIQAVIEHGSCVCAVFTQVGSANEPEWLKPATSFAIKNGADLLGETPSRFIRAIDFHQSNQQAQPTPLDYKRLDLATQDVVLVVVSKQERVWQVCRGKRKPLTKAQTKAEYKPAALALREQGFSLGEITKVLGVPRSTVQRWCTPE